MAELDSLSSSGGRLRQRALVAFVGLGIVVASAWLALVIVTRIDELFLPGEGISVGGLASLPGVDQGEAGPGDRFNVLVMGLDRRPSEGELPTRTDTMFVLSVDPQTKTAGLLGIPRDLWVEIPYRDGSGFFEARVNTAFVTGESEGYPGGGPALVKQVVEHNLGIAIDHHVIIDFNGFVELIDSLGGIDVYVPEVVDDPFYSHTELLGDYFPLHFEVGMHHMDGVTALGYARTRFDSSDLDRIQRQQRVIFAALEKATAQNLVNPTELVNLWRKYEGTIETDVNDFQAPGFARLASQIPQERITSLSIGWTTTGWITPDGQSVLLFDPALAAQTVQALLANRDVAQELALVEVQNGAGANGLAAGVIERLMNLGFPEQSLTAANTVDGAVRPATEIIDFSGKERTVEQIASVLSVPPERIRNAGPNDAALRTTPADVLVILGADAQAAVPTTSAPSGG